MRHLVLLGGSTGVGKTTTMKLLETRLAKTGFLDVDNVWRTTPDLAGYGRRKRVHEQVIETAKRYFDAGCETVVMSWVFAQSQLYQPVLDALMPVVDRITQLYLVAEERELLSRVTRRFEAEGGDGDLQERLDYAISRSQLIEALEFPKIDVTALGAREVADRVAAATTAPGPEPGSTR